MTALFGGLLPVPFLCLLASAAEVPLTVPAGSPLTVSVEKKAATRVGAPVKARVVDPVFAYDKLVIPVGSEVTGTVTGLKPVTRARRFNAIAGGDFTPLKDPQVRFDTLSLPNGDRLPIHAAESSGLGIVVHRRAQPASNKRKTVIGQGMQTMRDQIDLQKQAALENVHAGNKWERVQAAAYSRLPYHPQFIFSDTRFHSVLEQPLLFGAETPSPESMDRIGTAPASGTVVIARIVKDLTSQAAHQGTPVQAIVSQPLFSDDRHLILPEGATLTGTVLLARRARWFRRGGQLRFVFQQIEPLNGDATARPIAVSGHLFGIDAEKGENVSVDQEGAMKASPASTRFIAPLVSLALASRSLSLDRNHQTHGRGRTTGRILAGGVGFGVLGSIAAARSRNVASGLGYWGVAVSIYTHLIARGDELLFPADTSMEIRFGR